MPGDRPRTTPFTPSRSPFRSPGGAAALPLLSLVLLGQGRALAAEIAQPRATGVDPAPTLTTAAAPALLAQSNPAAAPAAPAAGVQTHVSRVAP